ncbi:hypothetical protein V8C37DRAFT_391378 [Trichoderma ceciliae]
MITAMAVAATEDTAVPALVLLVFILALSAAMQAFSVFLTLTAQLVSQASLVPLFTNGYEFAADYVLAGETPKSVKDFGRICQKNGKKAQCCAIPIVSSASVWWMEYMGVASNL